MTSPAPARPVLTPLQQEILEGFSRGETPGRIGHRLHYSEHHIRDLIGGILRALGAVNQAHAVRIAYDTGLLNSSVITPALREALNRLVVVAQLIPECPPPPPGESRCAHGLWPCPATRARRAALGKPPTAPASRAA